MIEVTEMIRAVYRARRKDGHRHPIGEVRYREILHERADAQACPPGTALRDADGDPLYRTIDGWYAPWASPQFNQSVPREAVAPFTVLDGDDREEVERAARHALRYCN